MWKCIGQIQHVGKTSLIWTCSICVVMLSSYVSLFSSSISCFISCVFLILALFTVWLMFDLNLTSAWMQLAGMERSLHCSRIAAGFSPPFDFVSFLPNCRNHVTYCITVTGCHLSTVCGFSQWDSWWYQSHPWVHSPACILSARFCGCVIPCHIMTV